jgi:hypothetical protein
MTVNDELGRTSKEVAEFFLRYCEKLTRTSAVKSELPQNKKHASTTTVIEYVACR